MVEAPEAPTPPQGKVACSCLFQMWPAGVSKLLYRLVPSGKAQQGMSQRVQAKNWSKPRTGQSQGFHMTTPSCSEGLMTAEAWLEMLQSRGLGKSSVSITPGKLGRAPSEAILCCGIPIGVLGLHSLGWGPALSQTQFKVVFDCHKEVLECHSCQVKEPLQKLLVGLLAAGNAVLLSTAAAVGQAAFTALLLGALDIDLTAANHQKILPFTNIS